MILFYMASFLSTRAKMKTVRIAYRFCFGHIVRNRTADRRQSRRPGGASRLTFLWIYDTIIQKEECYVRFKKYFHS